MQEQPLLLRTRAVRLSIESLELSVHCSLLTDIGLAASIPAYVFQHVVVIEIVVVLVIGDVAARGSISSKKSRTIHEPKM